MTLEKYRRPTADELNEEGNNRNLKVGDKLENTVIKPCISEGISGIPKTEFCFGVFCYLKQLLFQHIWSRKVLYQYGAG